MRCATKALSYRSASSPPSPDRKKNGAISVAPASVIKTAELAPETANKITKTSAVLRKLSPNAAKNWHQNKGAKRRVVSSDTDMFLSSFARSQRLIAWLDAVPAARPP